MKKKVLIIIFSLLLCIVLFLFIFFYIKNNETNSKNIAIKSKIEEIKVNYDNVKENNNTKKDKASYLENTLKDKIEEKDIWLEIKENLKKALS